VYPHKKLEIANRSKYSPLQTSPASEIQTKVEKVDDSPGTFICTLIPVSGTHVHQTSEQLISSKLFMNCATSSPNLNKP